MRVETPTEDQSIKGILALIIATLFFAFQDAMTKHLTETVSVPQIITIRFFFFSLFALTFAHFKCGISTAIRSSRIFLQLSRSVLIVSEIALFSLCLHYLGIAEMHAIFSSFPILVTALSVPLLGEVVGWRRWVAIVIGFIGTLIIINPTNSHFNIYYIAAIACALLFAFYNIITRLVSRTDRFETSLLYFGIVGFVLSLIFVPFYWEPLNQSEVFWLLAVSATSIIGHLLLIKALQLTAAVILQPFNYFILVWAIIIGFIVYQEVLALSTLIGATLVVTSGIYIAHREYRVSKEKRKQLRRSLYKPNA